MRQCIFCDNRVENLEHTFPEWVLKKISNKRPYRLSIGGREPLSIPGYNSTVKSTCTDCNCGWMSRLETSASRLIGPLSQDIGMWLTVHDQQVIARWAVKTAMVFDSLDRKTQERGYNRQQHEELRLGTALPFRTTIWIGRYTHTGLAGIGNRFDINIPEVPKACNGCIATFLLDHLLIQVVTVNSPREYDNVEVRIRTKRGPWSQSLVQVWPASRTVCWPPLINFTPDGALTVSDLLDRLEVIG